MDSRPLVQAEGFKFQTQDRIQHLTRNAPHCNRLFYIYDLSNKRICSIRHFPFRPFKANELEWPPHSMDRAKIKAYKYEYHDLLDKLHPKSPYPETVTELSAMLKKSNLNDSDKLVIKEWRDRIRKLMHSTGLLMPDVCSSCPKSDHILSLHQNNGLGVSNGLGKICVRNLSGPVQKFCVVNEADMEIMSLHLLSQALHTNSVPIIKKWLDTTPCHEMKVVQNFIRIFLERESDFKKHFKMDISVHLPNIKDNQKSRISA